MNKNVNISRNDGSVRGRGVEDVNRLDTNDNSNNNKGDDVMNIIDKKTWKKLSKSKSYGKYANLALENMKAIEEAKEAKRILSANREEILKFKDDIDDWSRRVDDLNKKIHDKKIEIQKLSGERDFYKEKSEKLEVENAKGAGKADAALEIAQRVQAELDKQRESITDDYEVYDDCSDELSAKSRMINRFKKQIKQNQKEIALCKHDIKLGVAVNFNKKMIRDLEAQNRYCDNQINCFQATFNDFKSKKTIISETIDSKRTNYEELKESWKIVSENIGF